MGDRKNEEMDKSTEDILLAANLGLNDAPFFSQQLVVCLINIVGVNPDWASRRDWFYALAYLLRGEMRRSAIKTGRAVSEQDAKRVYYLSMEYLPGRSLIKNLLDLGILETARKALKDLGLDLDEVAQCEFDAALGNGGLGRLAACFLDSLATQGYPAIGYGLRYEFGMFTQAIENGQQVERPEGWLRYGNPWEFERSAIIYTVHFRGRVVSETDAAGRKSRRWVDTEEVIAMAFDETVAGYRAGTAATRRLWAARATREFDFANFNDGNYIDAVRSKAESENLSKVLYPNDSTAVGQELRLKQEYFFVSASLQDIVSRFLRTHNAFDLLPEKAAIQLNDTHPALAVAELMRILVDEHDCSWQGAWEITRRTFSYTNHTLLPEALETWPIEMMESMLPRLSEIIYRINHDFLMEVKQAFPGDAAAVRRMSVIDDEQRRIRMAHLAIIGSHKVNGVAELHTKLLRTTTFADFDRFYPGKIVNMTNGVTPRRWLLQANPGLAALITRHIGEGWITDLEQLSGLGPLADDKEFRKEFLVIKQANKERLARLIADTLAITVDPESLFDVQVKRIHEYKRQLLNILQVVTRYNRMRDKADSDPVPRTVIFAGKAAPGYFMAKSIIRLIHDVASTINGDTRVGDRLKVVFLPNFNVSAAEVIMPAGDLSEQISTAGTEASGTGNMKLALNGALTIGTLDGANIEIRDAVGDDNIFIFGLTADEAEDLHLEGYDPWHYYHANPDLKRSLDMIRDGAFSPDEPDRHRAVVDSLLGGGDRYLLLADYASYLDCQEKVDGAFRMKDDWTRRAVINVASVGRFSSDRTIRACATDIWNVTPIQI